MNHGDQVDAVMAEWQRRGFGSFTRPLAEAAVDVLRGPVPELTCVGCGHIRDAHSAYGPCHIQGCKCDRFAGV